MLLFKRMILGDAGRPGKRAIGEEAVE